MSKWPAKILLWSGLCTAVVIGMGVQQGSPPAKGPNGRTELVRALGAQGQIEGRLTGGFGDDEGESQESDASSSPRRLADRGVFELFNQRWDEAIDLLEEAAARRPGDAKISSDLAAAYLERGRLTGRAFDDFLALVAAERAVTADPRLSEALFNRALAFERLGLTARARADWVRYLSLEKEGSDWHAEGEERLEALEHASLPRAGVDRQALEAAVARGDRAAVRAAVDPLRRPSRKLGEEELLAAWAHAHLARDAFQASRALDLARALGEALAGLSHDHLLRDTVAVIDAASPDQRETLARGHLDYQAGRALYDAADYAGAAARLRDAQGALARGGSPFALRAEYAIGSCERLLSLQPSALRRFTAVAAEADDHSYLSLLGESLWMEGLTHYVEQDLPPALTAYGRALETFEAIEETENIAGAHTLLAEAAEYEGRVEEGWQHRLSSLWETLKIGDAKRLFQVYLEATIAATRQWPQIALYFQEEALRQARLANDRVAITQALYWRSRNHQQLGMIAQAGEDLRRARAVLATVKTSQIKGISEADISLAEAELAAEKTPRTAIPLLSQALDLYQKSGYRYNLIETLESRAQAFASLGDLTAAEKDLQDAAGQIEDWRSRLDDPADRISFLAKSEQLFDKLILLYLEKKNDPDRAFDSLERQRARALLDSVLPTVEPLTTREVAAGLADDAAFVAYALLDDRLYAFVIDRRGVRLTRSISESWPLIETRIAAFRAGLAGHADAGELDDLSGKLYETLIAPLAGALPDGAHLILSSDGALQRLPFAALRNPRTGHYLVQDHQLTVAPSASVYLASVRRFRQFAQGAPRSVLLVSNSQGRRSDPRPLQWAAEEANRVAALYPGTVVRKDQEATVATFLRDAPNAEIVHFLGHAIKSGDARGTCLVLTAPPGSAGGASAGDDLLCGQDIERLRLNRTRLVILSACGTADGRIARGEGIESIARSFVAAGAPAVIGTSWNVKDKTANLFVTELHRKLRMGMEPGEALRRTQLGFIGGPKDQRSPQFWANFQLTGGTFLNPKQ